MNTPPQEKLKMLNGSIRCLKYGLLGVVPFLGLPFGVAALWISGQVRQQEKHMWNAAKPYRIAGAVCGAVGILFWFGVVAMIAIHAAASYVNAE